MKILHHLLSASNSIARENKATGKALPAARCCPVCPFSVPSVLPFKLLMVASRERWHPSGRQGHSQCHLHVQTGKAPWWDSTVLERSRVGTAPQMQGAVARAALSVLETFREGKTGRRDVSPAPGPSHAPPRSVGGQGVPQWLIPKSLQVSAGAGATAAPGMAVGLKEGMRSMAMTRHCLVLPQ